MTRGALGFGNWIYIALFSNQDSMFKNTQDHANVEFTSAERDALKASIKTGDGDKTKHKGRKPSALMEKLVETFTEPGEFVIDPFLGSGSTLFACDKLGRACVGGEIDPEYCNEIIGRWQDENGQAAEGIKDVSNGI